MRAFVIGCKQLYVRASTATVGAKDVVCFSGKAGKFVKMEHWGWLPTHTNDAETLIEAPLEAGQWRMKVTNEAGLELRSQPDYAVKYRMGDEFLIPRGAVIEATHRVAGKHGDVFYRVAGTSGWVFQTREGQQTMQPTQEPITRDAQQAVVQATLDKAKWELQAAEAEMGMAESTIASAQQALKQLQ
eukprot:TRINITY_DN64173_c0_g5_i1.p1 TRINITY_DN64173_c0_g5~~TRINITY_DN64173_c0_g5_i1.p1  ORF type:complete len:187 (+),score=33.86 TRINITY_DN64173_c0_g5_i1:143-703(+)